jgi:hypothetical protein
VKHIYVPAYLRPEDPGGYRRLNNAQGD